MTDKCLWYEIAVNQREHEVERGEGIMGTRRFSDQGCYDCNALNTDCIAYMSAKEFEGRIKVEVEYNEHRQ